MNHTIAIDLGGTIVKIGLLKEGQLIDRCEMTAQSALGLKSQLPQLETAIDLILSANYKYPVLACYNLTYHLYTHNWLFYLHL